LFAFGIFVGRCWCPSDEAYHGSSVHLPLILRAKFWNSTRQPPHDWCVGRLSNGPSKIPSNKPCFTTRKISESP
jgi:hypothetical protein